MSQTTTLPSSVLLAPAERLLSLACTALLLLLLLAASGSAQAVDRVTFLGGNFLEGEVKSLVRGTLNFDTEEMDVVGVDWDDVASLTSAQFFDITDVDGRVYRGSLTAPGQVQTLAIALSGTVTDLPYSRVVEIVSIEQGFMARTSGFVDLGTTLARANNLASILLGGRFAYGGPKWDFSLNGETYYQRQETTTELGEVLEEETTRNSASVTGKRLFSGSFAATASTQAEQNQELNLDLRLLGVLGGEYQIIRNQAMEFFVGAGAVLNSESFTGSERTQTGEINVNAGFDAFDIGDLNVYTLVNTYTSPVDGGRVRVDVDGRVSWEAFADFFISFNIVEKYDSKPPTAAAGRDFQYGLTLGWSWG